MNTRSQFIFGVLGGIFIMIGEEEEVEDRNKA